METTLPAGLYRQGDVFVLKIEDDSVVLGAQLPRDTQGRIVLAHGEVTGHAHAIYTQGAELFRASDAANNGVFLKVVKPVALKHEEHTQIGLPPGLYRVMRQSEYSPEEIRYVAD